METNIFKFKGNNNPKIKSLHDNATLKFLYNKEDLKNPEVFEHFVKGCEYCIRHDPRYKNYISHLKEHGLNKDTFMSGLTDDTVTIEMHHGPIFSLFDICSIVIDALLAEDEKICVFDIADRVLTEHEKNHIQIVMLSTTAHQEVGAGNMFINYKQSFGNINEFLKKYKKGLKRDNLYSLKKYIALCKEHDSTDNNLLEVISKIKKLKK